MVGTVVMDLPDISAWNAGQEHDEAEFNDLSYALSFLLNPPECVVQQTAVQAIPNGTTTATAVRWDAAVKDNDGMFDASTPTYITIQTPGWYEIEWAVSWGTKADATIRIQPLFLNGAYGIGSAIAYNEYGNDSGTTPQVWMVYDTFLNVGDQLAVGLMQSSGANLNTASSATLQDQQTFLHVRWASL
jgi:hypothetical protein